MNMPTCFDRIRAGYALPDVQHFAVDREVELLSQQSRFPRPNVQARRALPALHRQRTREAAACHSNWRCCRSSKARSIRSPIRAAGRRGSGSSSHRPARHYGLEQNWWIDERRDVIEATGAALTYLQYLNTLLRRRLVSRDRGLQRRRRHRQRRGSAQPAQRACRPISSACELRAETRDYVPKLLAISRIVRSPDAYGLRVRGDPERAFLRPRRTRPPGRPRRRRQLAGVSRDEMFALNPGYNRMTTPPARPASAAAADRQCRPVPEGHARSGRPVDRSAGASPPRNRRRPCTTA